MEFSVNRLIVSAAFILMMMLLFLYIFNRIASRVGNVSTMTHDILKETKELIGQMQEGNLAGQEDTENFRIALNELSNGLHLAQGHLKFLSLLNRKTDALGARWGKQSEIEFREGMEGILTEFEFSVETFREMDADAKVFRLPSLVEVDVVVRNGKTFLVEIKASISDRDVFAFDKITEFYETTENRKADYKAIISPYIDDRAKVAAEKLGIRLYTDSTEFATQEPDSGEAND